MPRELTAAVVRGVDGKTADIAGHRRHVALAVTGHEIRRGYRTYGGRQE
jgi:hypothetical protein